MRAIEAWFTGLVDALLRLVRSHDNKTRNRCPECGAGVGRECENPYCYGSLGDVPRGEDDNTTASDRAAKVMRAYTGSRTQNSWDDKKLADVIADLLHLAEECGHDPYDVLDQAGNYYNGDVTGTYVGSVAR